MDRRAGIGVALVLAVASVAAACAPAIAGDPVPVTLADGSSALTWGDGEYGVVLVTDDGETAADWAALATEIADNRMTIVAPDPAGSGPDRLAAAAAWLTDDGVERVAYLASGTVGGEQLGAAARAGAAIDQLILISGDLTDADIADLGEPPKLFVAARGDDEGAASATRMTDAAAGTWNELLLVSGSAGGSLILDSAGGEELISGVVARLEERR